MLKQGRPVPAFNSDICGEAIEFCTGAIDASGVAERLEAMVAKATGRPRQLKVRAVLVALLLLALDDRPLHLKAATRLLFCRLPPAWRHRLGVTGEAGTKKAFLARYRQVRYLFGLALSVIDPSAEAKNRVMPSTEATGLAKKLTEAEMCSRRQRLEAVVNDLIEASAQVCSKDELAAFDGSVGLGNAPHCHQNRAEDCVNSHEPLCHKTLVTESRQRVGKIDHDLRPEIDQIEQLRLAKPSGRDHWQSSPQMQI